MPRVYVDTSAFVKNFSQEKNSSIMQKMFEECRAGRVTLVTSAWTINETAAVIDKKVRGKEITADERDRSIASLIIEVDSLVKEGKLLLIPVRQEFVESSFRHILERHLSADDSLQLFSATVGISDLFVAADEFLCDAAKSEGFESFNVERDEEASKLVRRLKLR